MAPRQRQYDRFCLSDQATECPGAPSMTPPPGLSRLDDAVYLTYDDGPNPKVTPRLLELLHRRQVKATFFASGHALLNEQGRALLRRIATDGHEIGNHGLHHIDGGCPAFCPMARLINEVTGHCPCLVRAPHGRRRSLTRYLSVNPRAIGIHWSLDFQDWNVVDIEDARSRIQSRLAPGSIVLMHDGASPDSRYRDREHVLLLTSLLIDHCESLGIPLRSLRDADTVDRRP